MIAALTIAVALTVPALASLREERAEWTLPAVLLKSAVRRCDAGSIDMILSSHVMHGRDREAVAAGEAFAAECEMSAQTADLVGRARRRLVDAEAR